MQNLAKLSMAREREETVQLTETDSSYKTEGIFNLHGIRASAKTKVEFEPNFQKVESCCFAKQGVKQFLYVLC